MSFSAIAIAGFTSLCTVDYYGYTAAVAAAGVPHSQK